MQPPAIRTPHDGREPTESGLLRRLAVAVEQGPLIVCVTDAAGRIEYVNPKFTVATGYPLPAVRGRTCRVLKSGSMDLLDYQRLWQTIASGSLWQGEFHNRRSDGTLYWERASIWPLRDGAGVITHFVKTAEDITERKREQQALRESEDNLRRVFEASADPILLLEAGTFVACNQATVDALGAAGKHEIVGKPPGALSPDLQPDGRVSAEKAMAMIALAEERGTHHFDWTHRRADGSLLPVDITLTLITLQGRRVLHVTWRDLSARLAAEAERERLQTQLLHAQKMEAVGRLAGGVAHDFNNMLGVIIGHAEMAIERIEEGSLVGRDLEAIRHAAQRSADLTRQLLGFARRQTAQPRLLDLNGVAADMRTMLGRLIGEDIDLRWQPGEALWPVRVDPAQVDQILTNLAVNARDAIAGHGSVTFATANVTLTPTDCAVHPGFVPGDYVRLLVRDTGCGMTGDVLQHLFEPFFTTKETGKGTGLGLATVYGIVRQNGGLIDVDSTPGLGTAFRVYLPRHLDAPVSPPADEPEPTRPKGGAETILVVEDEAAILDLTRTVLERHGYLVLAARTPAEAEAIAADRHATVDLLITDVVMPGMNGKDLAERLRAVRPGLKCLFMSGYAADVVATRGGIGFEGLYVQKPFTVRALSRSVRQALDG